MLSRLHDVARWLLLPLLLKLGRKRRVHLAPAQLKRLQRVETQQLRYLLDDSRRLDSAHPAFGLAATSQHAYNDFVDQKTRSLLELFGSFLLGILKDPDAPEPLHRAIDRGWERLWPDVEQEMRWGILDSLQLVDNETNLFRELRLRRWTARAPPPCPNPLAWARARLLHLVLPAEAKTVAHDVASTALYALNLVTAYEVCNVVTLLHFALIDKSDEYQLVHFLLQSKVAHFIAFGLIPVVETCFHYMNCVLLDVGTAHPCHLTATASPLSATLELARVIVAAAAFVLLRTRARGGPEQLARLEVRRLRLADTERTAAGIRAIAGGRVVQARGGKGGIVLAWLFAWDTVAFCAAAVVGMVNLAHKRAIVDCESQDCSVFDATELVDSDPLAAAVNALGGRLPALLADRRFWATLDFTQTSYSMCLGFYVVLALPPCKKFLTLCQRTGYDKGGALCWALSDDEKKTRKGQLEREEREEAAAAKIQALLRGAAARDALQFKIHGRRPKRDRSREMVAAGEVAALLERDLVL